MKIAISTDSGEVSPHFGRCPEFTIVNLEDGEIEGKKVIDNPGHKPGYIPEFLKGKGVECIISGGMGNKAISLFDRYDIKVLTGVKGKIDEVIERYMGGELSEGKNPCTPGGGKDYGVEREDKHRD